MTRPYIPLLASALVAIVLTCAVAPASALTAEIAKKCRQLAFEAHPPVRPGSKAGTSMAERDFYRTCITNASSSGPQATGQSASPQKNEK